MSRGCSNRVRELPVDLDPEKHPKLVTLIALFYHVEEILEQLEVMTK